MKEGWTYKKLGEVALQLIAGGDVPKNAFSNVKTELYNIPIFSNGVENDGLYGFTNEPKVTLPAITIAGRGTIGHLIVRDTPFFPIVRLISLVPNNDINIKYLYYRLSIVNFTYTGSSIPQLTVPIVKDVDISYPPLSEQRAIVSRLDAAFTQIDALKANAEKQLSEARQLFQAELTECMRPKGGWEKMTIGDVCLLKSGNSDANNSEPGNLPYVKVGDMNIKGNENYITVSSTYVDRKANEKNIFPIGTLIFPKRGGAIFTNKKRLTEVEICCDLNVMGVIPKKDYLIPLFLYYFFNTIDFNMFKNEGASIPQINNKNIAPITIFLPSLSEQQQIVARLDALSANIRKLEEVLRKTIAECDALKQTMLREIFE